MDVAEVDGSAAAPATDSADTADEPATPVPAATLQKEGAK